MKLLYQGVPGAYSHIACTHVEQLLERKVAKIEGLPDFKSVWEKIDNTHIGVLPVENSYAGNIHENLYHFLRYDYKIIGEINLEIHHCLISKEKNIKNISKVYSHPQALSQCHDYLKKNKIHIEAHTDTAGAAQMISENNESGVAAIASDLAAKTYGLHILDRSIQDQKGNTTKFFVIVPKNSRLKMKNKKKKTSILFESKNIPAALYKCLGAFATNGVNLTKIESMPSLKGPFTYLFWMNFEGTLEDKCVEKSLEELQFFTNDIKILGEY